MGIGLSDVPTNASWAASLGYEYEVWADDGTLTGHYDVMTDFDDAPHLLAFTRDWLLTLPPALNALLGAERVSPREYGTKLAVQMASGRYPRHVDNACADGGGPRDKRWITCIYYLQEPGSDLCGN